MKTDSLFYELFQAAPQTFFELLQITAQCAYRFESITVKASEKRIDGVLEPSVEGAPIYFLEVQAFPDAAIYWRTMREVSTYFEQRPQVPPVQWQAIVLWLNKRDDPGFGMLAQLANKRHPHLISANLLQLLHKLEKSDHAPLVLRVLRPLLAKSENEIRIHVVEWVRQIRQLPGLDAPSEELLVSLLSQFIEQKFTSLNYEELSKMLRLRPLRELDSYRMLLIEDHVDVIMLHIQAKFNIDSELRDSLALDLRKLDLPVVKSLFVDLLYIGTVEQLEQWIADHPPPAPPMKSKRKRK